MTSPGASGSVMFFSTGMAWWLKGLLISLGFPGVGERRVCESVTSSLNFENSALDGVTYLSSQGTGFSMPSTFLEQYFFFFSF